MVSAGKMSGLWSGNPASIKLADLDVICVVLGCGVEELLIPEPGKIPHELRQGELAFRHVIPHTPYYGTVDATPLFLMRAADYYAWTGDLETLRTQDIVAAVTDACAEKHVPLQL